jgi:DHHA1 domain
VNTTYLKTIRKIIAHDHCPDGRASALICHEVLPDAEIEFVQYQSPRHKALTPEPGVLFVDFTPWAEREEATPENRDPPLTEAGKALLQAWVDAGAMVLDHHRGGADIVAAFGERGVFADEKENPGVSGAVLAWREVFAVLVKGKSKKAKADLTSEVGKFALLAGIRDTWQTNDPGWIESCDQAAALMFWPWERLLEAGVLGIILGLEPLLEIGPVLRARDFERDTKTLQESYTIEFGGRKFVCFEGTHTSDIAERVQADMVIGWHYLQESDGLKMQISCRSRGDFSALAFAKAYGGGGHVHAAGFKMPIRPENTAAMLVPYGAVEFLLGMYLQPGAFPGLKTPVAAASAVAAMSAGGTNGSHEAARL